MSVYVVDMDIFHCAENFVMLVVLWKVKQSQNLKDLSSRERESLYKVGVYKMFYLETKAVATWLLVLLKIINKYIFYQ